MFSDINKNIEMIEGTYRKLKRYYFYNKNYIFMKEKIAEFEYDKKSFEKSIVLLAKIIKNPLKYKKQINTWLELTDVYILPKSFKQEDNNLQIVHGIKIENAIVNKVNFFIDAPIEIHILDALWTILVGKGFYDYNDDICSYGNILDRYYLYNKKSDYKESINFANKNLFKRYYNQYSSWKNNSIKEIRRAYEGEKDTLLISLDVKEYFYSIEWNFDILSDYISVDVLKKIKSLTHVIEKIYESYQNILSKYRALNQKDKNTVLPIGLFSSMFLGNLYLNKFDKYVNQKENVLYYGRYVDDILILLDTTYKSFVDDNDIAETVLSNNFFCASTDDQRYNIYDYENLIIQNEKVKYFYFEYCNGDSLISKFEQTEIIPSECYVIPNKSINALDFYDAAYSIDNFSSNTKIRDIGHMKIDQFTLGKYMGDIIANYKIRIKEISEEERKEQNNVKAKILDFFQGVNACQYSVNWTNAFYFFIETCEKEDEGWIDFKNNIIKAIDGLTVYPIENIKKNVQVKTKIKDGLNKQLGISMATALALYPKFSSKESIETKNLSKKLRKANLFNHNLVKYPLINYLDELPNDLNLMNFPIEFFYENAKKIFNGYKIKWSPRFIHLDEIFFFNCLYKIANGGNCYRINSDLKIHKIKEKFYKINGIWKNSRNQFPIKIVNKYYDNRYIVQHVIIDNKIEYSKTELKVAIANVKMDIARCSYGLDKKVTLDYSQLTRILSEVYIAADNHADFLVLPEYYLPIEWIPDIIRFVRLSKVAVLTGLQFVCDDDNARAYNNLAVFLPVRGEKNLNACMFIREKNDYAELEKKILACYGYKCYNQQIPTYNVFETGYLKFGTFLCYEFTDIKARSLYKNKIELIFTPECNRDTAYFSSIIESLVRDLNIIIAQANTSMYGDSRITAPYSKDLRNIVQIKGGENDLVIMGKINITHLKEEMREQKKETRDFIKEVIKSDLETRETKLKELIEKTEKPAHISRISARIK